MDPADYEPVYPFLPPAKPGGGVIIPFPMPPFASDWDFYPSNQGGILNIRTSPPITHTLNGITLALGDGLGLQDGKLVATGGTATMYKGKVPIMIDPATKTISLAIDNNTLNVTNSVLTARTYSAAPPLSVVGDLISLNIGSGFKLTNNALDVNVGNGLTANSGPITVNIGKDGGLMIDAPTGQMKLNITAPMETSAVGLGISMGPGMRVNDGGQLTLALKAPVATDGNGVLGLNVGNGLQVNASGALEINGSYAPAFTTSSPLQLQNGTLSLQTAAPLAVSNNSLSVTCAAPITVSSNSISLNVGGGLTVSSGALTTNITYNAPLTNSNNTVGLNLGNALKVENNKIHVNATPPIITDTQSVKLQYSAPLINQDNKLALSVGSGLSIANGQLTATGVTPSVQAPLHILNNTVNLNINQNQFKVNSTTPSSLTIRSPVYSYMTKAKQNLTMSSGTISNAKVWLHFTKLGLNVLCNITVTLTSSAVTGSSLTLSFDLTTGQLNTPNQPNNMGTYDAYGNAISANPSFIIPAEDVFTTQDLYKGIITLATYDVGQDSRYSRGFVRYILTKSNGKFNIELYPLGFVNGTSSFVARIMYEGRQL